MNDRSQHGYNVTFDICIVVKPPFETVEQLKYISFAAICLGIFRGREENC